MFYMYMDRVLPSTTVLALDSDKCN